MNWKLTPDKHALMRDPYRIRQTTTGLWALYVQPWMYGSNIPTRRLVGMYETINAAKAAAQLEETK